MTYQSSELSIISMQESESGLKQGALYHYIASLGDRHSGHGWLAKDDGSMMMVSNTLLRNQSISQKGQSLPFPLVAGWSNGCFFMVQQPWFLVSRTYLPMICTITYHTR